jgi:hypothetical protein
MAVLRRDVRYHCPECIETQVGGHIQNHLKRAHGYRYAGMQPDVMMSETGKPLLLKELKHD